MSSTALACTSPPMLDKVRVFEATLRQFPQAPITTYHLFHGGMYARTITLKKGVTITGALMKLATVVIISGDVTGGTNDGPVRITGYAVLPGAVGRKQTFYAHEDTQITMLLPTAAKTVREVEQEFTDEVLLSTVNENIIRVTGE